MRDPLFDSLLIKIGGEQEEREYIRNIVYKVLVHALPESRIVKGKTVST